jgi:hypothetical protein
MKDDHIVTLGIMNESPSFDSYIRSREMKENALLIDQQHFIP